MPSETKTDRAGALADSRVLELGSLIAGPTCGRLLAEFGAEVIKVEPVGDGDPLRNLGGKFQGRALWAASVMRNKKLIAVDLRSSRGQDVIRRLAARCDVLIENFQPGTMEKWGLGYSQLKQVNPAIIMVRVSGFGQDGPYSQRPGYGIIGEALSGLRSLVGDPDRPPSRVAMPLTDYLAGMYAALGALMALHHRSRTGEGQVVDAALCEAAFSLIDFAVPAYEKLGTVANRAGSRLPGHAPNNLYATRDGKHIHIAGAGQSIFRRLTEVMARPDLATDKRFSDDQARAQNQDELDTLISEWTGQFDLMELVRRLEKAGVPAARINTVADIFDDPHFKARAMLLQVPDEQLGDITLSGIVPKLSATPGKVTWAGGRVGQHTREVLSEVAQLSSVEIDELESAGTIQCDPSPTSTAHIPIKRG